MSVFHTFHETLIWASKNSKSRHYFDYETMKSMAGGKQMKTVWRILPPSREEKVFGKHPTQKPIELLKRIFLASTQPGDMVLDPFMGSGTTGCAAVLLDRKFVGIDLDDKHVDLAKRRIQSALRDDTGRKFSVLSGLIET